jgi:G3E family GTPase
VGFADRLLLSKTDLIGEDEVADLMDRLRDMNPRAHQKKVHFGATDIREILDIRGFNLSAALEIDPEFLAEGHHHHDDDVKSFVWKDPRPLQMEKIETFLSLMVQNYGEDLLRYEGILNIQGEPRRMIFQGVHMLMGGTPGKPWGAGEPRESVMVFIGRRIPRRLFEEGLAYCVA